jgi:hypothetical protein
MNGVGAPGASSERQQHVAIWSALILALLTVVGTALNRLPLRVLVLLLALALIAVVTVLVNAGIARNSANRATREHIARLRSLISPWPPRSAATLSPYVLGVRSPAATISQGKLFPEYVARDLDPDVETAMQTAAIVLIVGPACAGKSRTAFEALGNAPRTRDALVLAPDDKNALTQLLAAPDCILEQDKKYVLWLDDLDRFLDDLHLRDLDGFICSPDPYDNGADEVPGVTVVATLREDVFLSILDEGGDKAHVLRGFIARAERVVMRAELSPGEQERLAKAYPDARAGASFVDVFGKTLLQLGHPIYRDLQPAPPPPKRWSRLSLPPAAAGALAVGLAGLVVFVGLRDGWTNPPPLADVFKSIKSMDEPCGGVGVSPSAAESVQHDVVRILHRSDGCPESDVVQVFKRDDETLSSEPSSSFQPSSEQKAAFQCLGADRADQCHPDVVGGKQLIVGAWRDPVTQQRMPVAIYASGKRYEVDALDLRAPVAATRDASVFGSQFAQRTLTVKDLRTGTDTLLQGSPMTIALMLPTTEMSPARLVAGYAVAQELDEPRIVAQGFQLGLSDGKIAAVKTCSGKPGSRLGFEYRADGTDALTLRRAWLRAEAAKLIDCR